MLARVLTRLLALSVGLVVGFFAAFNMVFSDVFGLTDMIAAVGYVFAAYLVVGTAFGALGRATGARWVPWLAIPGLLMVVVGLFDSPARFVYVSAVALAVVGGAFAGTWLGARAASAVIGRRADSAGAGSDG